ncbi:hypothetical protein [Comamonas thiooxydans]|uniref:hypothetical protein n=1 Tax=Comamonas thiooxydans TaxID=363952 RepID=UPI000A44D23A|nr:hypothetical protein [Comamonas thiooxydans]
MNQTLFHFHHHVLPGDVLLLRSLGFKAHVNRGGQRALRPLNEAKFTHVAIVIDPGKIAEAMPGDGVRLREWKKSEGSSTYDLNSCVVARHPDLVYLATDPAPLLDRVQFYYSQKYKLTSLSSKVVHDQAGIVCSQFVALVLQDLGLPALVSNPMRALPSDIDRSTQEKGGWRQFPFSDYGLHPNVSSPPDNDPYWSVLAQAQVSALAKITASTPTTPVVSTAIVGAQPAGSLFGIANHEVLSENIGSQIASSMKSTEAVLRACAELDRHVLSVCESLKDDPEIGQSVSFGESASVNTSGQSLLDQWHGLFIDHSDSKPRVLANADASVRIARHRDLLGESIVKLLHLARERVTQCEAFLNQMSSLATLLKKGQPVQTKLVSKLDEQCELLTKGTEWLEVEASDILESRLQADPPLGSTALDLAKPKLGDDVFEQAKKQLNDMIALDQIRHKWMTQSKPSLQKLSPLLRDLETQLSGSYPTTRPSNLLDRVLSAILIFLGQHR